MVRRKPVVEDDIYLRPFDQVTAKLLVSRGVPYADIPTTKNCKKADVSSLLTKIDREVRGVPTKTVSASKQYKDLVSIMANPLRGNYLMAIGSFPSDLKAKHLACTILNHAITTFHGESRKHGRGLPIWHRVYGGFSPDPIRDKSVAEVPSLIVLSNVDKESTPVKLEKLKDILEKYSHIPRIVVTGGDPACDLLVNRLHCAVRVSLYLGPTDRIKEI